MLSLDRGYFFNYIERKFCYSIAQILHQKNGKTLLIEDIYHTIHMPEIHSVLHVLLFFTDQRNKTCMTYSPVFIILRMKSGRLTRRANTFFCKACGGALHDSWQNVALGACPLRPYQKLLLMISCTDQIFKSVFVQVPARLLACLGLKSISGATSQVSSKWGNSQINLPVY